MIYKITCRVTGALRFEGEFGSLKLCLEAAVKADAYLAGADLAGANLAGADLAGADLADADLADAKWRNGITLRRAPLMLYGLDYPVIVLDDHLQIGCELHTIAEWSAFDNERIARMDGTRARRFWDRHKAALLSLAASDGRGTAAAPTTEEAA